MPGRILNQITAVLDLINIRVDTFASILKTNMTCFWQGEQEQLVYNLNFVLQTESQLFPPTTGGAEAMASELGLNLLGKLPLDPRIGKTILFFRSSHRRCFIK